MKPIKYLSMITLLLSSIFGLAMEDKNNNIINNKIKLEDKKKFCIDLIDQLRVDTLTKIGKVIESGQDINQIDEYGETPLIKICKTRYSLTSKFYTEILREKYPTLIEKNKKEIINISFYLAEFLIKNGANLNIRNNSGENALMLAARNHDKKMVKLLIDSGANIKLQDKDNRTALFYTCYSPKNDIFILLLNAGANLYIKTKIGHSIFDLCTENKERIELLKKAEDLLIRKINTAITNEDKKLIAILIIQNPEFTDQDGNNALHIAAKNFKPIAFNIIWKIQPNLFNKINYLKQTPVDAYPEMICQLITAKKLSLKNKTEDKNINGKHEEK